MSLADGLGIIAVVISIIAIIIAIKSDRIIRAVANLNFDEKLAIMAGYLIDTQTDKSRATIERLRNDFAAVSNLKIYTSDDRKDKLITFYIIPILGNLLEGGNITGESAVLVKEIIDAAHNYNIRNDKISELRMILRDN